MAYYDTLTLEKGMYGVAGKSFSQVLEELDPSAHYAGTELGELDAFERQLKRFDIKVSGVRSDAVDKFFAAGSSAALFPEYVSRAVRQGMEEANVLDKLVASRTVIDSLDYRSVASEPSEDDRELKRVGEGAMIPQTRIEPKKNLIRLYKRGRMIVASYEAIKHQRIDLFTVTVKQVGAYIAVMQLRDAVRTLRDGDGNDNAIATTATAGAKLAYEDIIALWNKLDPYELNTVVASPALVAAILAMPEFKHPLSAGANTQVTGQLATPMGASLVRCAGLDDGLIGLDRRFALEMVTAGDVSVEYDKLIDRQLERAAITVTAGFAKIFDGASHRIGG